MSGGAFIFLIVVGIFVIWIFKIIGNAKKETIVHERNEYYENLKLKMPIHYTENLGKEYKIIGNISSSNEDKMEAEIDLMEQAEKQKARAIIILNDKIETQTGGSVGVERSVITGNRYISDTRYSKNIFHYNAIAIKFIENESEKISTQQNIFQENTNELDSIVQKLEEESITELDKLKKLLESGIIDESEYQNRISNIKTKFIQKKEELIYSSKLKNAIKKLEDEANIKFEKQKKLFNMNLIDKKEYEKKMTSIENELNTRKKDLKI